MYNYFIKDFQMFFSVQCIYLTFNPFQLANQGNVKIYLIEIFSNSFVQSLQHCERYIMLNMLLCTILFIIIWYVSIVTPIYIYYMAHYITTIHGIMIMGLVIWSSYLSQEKIWWPWLGSAAIMIHWLQQNCTLHAIY